MLGFRTSLWSTICFLWRLATFPELILRPLVMSLWIRKTFLNEHPVLLLAARVSPAQPEPSGVKHPTTDTDQTASDSQDPTSRPVERMSLIAAKQYLCEPALVALLFEKRIVAIEEEITSPDKESSDRTPSELAVIAELNHEAARIIGSRELAQSTGITLGRRLLASGRPRRAVPAFLRSVRLAQERNDAGGIAVGLWLAGESYREIGQIDRAMRCLSEAAENGHRAGVRVEPVARTSLGQMLTQRGNFSEAAAALDAAQDVCRRGVRDYLPNVLSAQAYLRMLQGQGEAALDAIREAVLIEKDRDPLVTLLQQQAGIHQYLGLTDELPKISDRILSLSSEKSESDEASTTSTGHGYLADVLGRVREFRYKLDFERRLVQERREAGDMSGHADALITLGTTFGRLCDVGQVDSCFSSAVNLYERIGRRSVESSVYSQWAAAIANCGNIERAIELQRRALEAAERMELRLAHCELLAGLADLLIRNQHFDEAGDCCRQALSECEDIQWAGGRIQPTLRLAETLLRRGADIAEALALLNQAVELSANAGSIDSQVQSKIDLVRFLVAHTDASSGDLETAQRHLESAEQQAREIGDPDVLRVVLMLRGQCEEAIRKSGWEERSRQLYVEAIQCYCRQRLAAPAIRDEPFETPYRVSLQAASQELFDRAMLAAERLGEDTLLFWIAELKHAQVLAELIRGDYLFLMPPLDVLQRDRMPEPAPGEALLVYSLLRDPDASVAGENSETNDARPGASGGQVRGILALLKLPGPDGGLHRIQIPWDATAPVDYAWNTALQELTESLGHLRSRYESVVPEPTDAPRIEPSQQILERQSRHLVEDSKSTLNEILQRYRGLLFPDRLLELCRGHEIHRLVIVPEGPLYNIPFPALTLSQSWDPDIPARHLIDEFNVVTVPSIALWQECRQRQPDSANVPLLGVAEPQGSNLAGNGDADFIASRLIPCVSSGSTGNSRILSGSGATREQFLEAASEARVIHLMLHGSAASDDENQGTDGDARRHQIQMAGQNDGATDAPSPSADMTDEALFRLVHSGHAFPACRLMTMNVCFSFRTGQRDLRPEFAGHSPSRESGEISGFPAAILALGVPTLIGSHWELYDLPGRLFFEEFYRQFGNRNETAAVSYREAIQTLRKYRDADNYPWFDNPYYWASVALMGDGERRHDT